MPIIIKLTPDQIRRQLNTRVRRAAFGPLSPPKHWPKASTRPQASTPRPAAALPKEFDYLQHFTPVPSWLQVERHAAVPTATPVPAVPEPSAPPVIDEPVARTTRTTLLTE